MPAASEVLCLLCGSSTSALLLNWGEGFPGLTAVTGCARWCQALVFLQTDVSTCVAAVGRQSDANGAAGLKVCFMAQPRLGHWGWKA
jgi:hypothetical protein